MAATPGLTPKIPTVRVRNTFLEIDSDSDAEGPADSQPPVPRSATAPVRPKPFWETLEPTWDWASGGRSHSPLTPATSPMGELLSSLLEEEEDGQPENIERVNTANSFDGPGSLGDPTPLGAANPSPLGNIVSPVIMVQASPGWQAPPPVPPPPHHAPICIPDGGHGPSPPDAPPMCGGPPPEEMPLPAPLESDLSAGGEFHRIRWAVDEKRLTRTDKQLMSPKFDIPLKASMPNATFKMMLYPKVVNDGRGGASFKKAKGKGKVILKYFEDSACPLPPAATQFRLRFSVGHAQPRPDGGTEHNFAEAATFGLHESIEEWDFEALISPGSSKLEICLEIMCSCGAPGDTPEGG